MFSFLPPIHGPAVVISLQTSLNFHSEISDTPVYAEPARFDVQPVHGLAELSFSGVSVRG
jgi:hypothetical protein